MAAFHQSTLAKVILGTLIGSGAVAGVEEYRIAKKDADTTHITSLAKNMGGDAQTIITQYQDQRARDIRSEPNPNAVYDGQRLDDATKSFKLSKDAVDAFAKDKNLD